MKISYNWIKWYVPEIPEPNRLADLFTYHICEVESVEKLPDGDYVFDLGILPNRAHDLLSHHGVARELSGLLGIKYNDPTSMYKVPASVPTNLKVEIQTPACRRYSARIVRNVKIGPSPEWVVKHLESIGQRSINNIVDATNIVMYDCGQPCHAFDLAKLSAEKIVITNPKEGMELPVVGRDAIVAKLKDTDIVTIDGEKNLALGGVKGGLDSGICDTTTDIVLEVANFDPVAVRKTARRLGLLSDSAKRFENDLSPSLCDFGMLELTGMILEILPEAIFEDVVDIYPTKQEERTLKFSKSYIDNILGTEVLEKEIENILTRYNYEFTKQESEIPASGEPTRGPENLSTDKAVKSLRATSLISFFSLHPTYTSSPFFVKIVPISKIFISSIPSSGAFNLFNSYDCLRPSERLVRRNFLSDAEASTSISPLSTNVYVITSRYPASTKIFRAFTIFS